MPLFKYKTLVDVLLEKTHTHPNKVLYTFLSDGEAEDGGLTYQQLDQKARAIAVLLQQNLVQPGERVLLLYPPGLEYICAFWGCLYAGMIAVPDLRLLLHVCSLARLQAPKTFPIYPYHTGKKRSGFYTNWLLTALLITSPARCVFARH